jgi:predicted dehydrogenase
VKIWAEAFSQILQVKFVAVTDENEERGRDFSSEYGARFYSDYGEFLDDEEINFVQVSAENYRQASTAIKAIEAGKNVFCEKPTATSTEDSRKLVEAARKAGVKMTTGFAWRFDPAFKRVKELIDDSTMGTLYMAKMFMGHGEPGGIYGDYAADEKKMGGGIFIELGCHCADMLTSWMGEAESISAQINNIALRYEGEDNAIATVKFHNGAVADITVTRSLKTDYFDVRAEVIGSDAHARIDLKKKPSLSLYSKKAPILGRIYPTLPQDTWPRTAGYRLLAEDFVKSILEDRKPEVTVEDAYRALQIIVAGYESAKTGKSVKITRNL